MHLNWTKCQGDVWCKLYTVNLSHQHFNDKQGVYIIWHGGTSPKVVYIGQGDIKSRITEHRLNPQIKRFENLGLYVTWAIVSEQNRDGVEAYLASRWSPIVDDTHTQAAHIEVNLPWE